MANTFGTNPMVLDTVNDDSSYDSSHDAINGGVKYTSGRVKIKKIQVIDGANTNAVLIKSCSPSALEGSTIFNVTLETGDLNKSIDFGNGQWFSGIIAKTLGGSSKVLIYFA